VVHDPPAGSGRRQDKDPAPHVPAPAAGQGADPVPRVPAPGGGRPAAAGVLTPDWMDDAEWQHACASRRDDECPPDEDGQDAEWFADPDHGPPPELAGVPFEVLAAQIEADGAADAAATARMIGLGVCREGYAHRPGAAPGPAAARRRRSRRAPRMTRSRRIRCWARWPMRPPARAGPSPG
jgi:hypothetical protein